MRYKDYDIVLQEVPNEISLSFTITGCRLSCDGCHSPYLWKEGSGEELTPEIFIEIVNKYKSLISCVLFMGGEWEADKLIKLLIISRKNGLKTALYSGLEYIDYDIFEKLDYLKLGPWVKELGGLSSEITNQKFINVKTSENLNHLFRN
jgi:anaerobic ribonucleoside-triphosphate reductase activating protein